MINCLEYALKFWNENKNYKIHYNSDHCINVPTDVKVPTFLPIEDFGHSYFEKWYTQGLITKDGKKLLDKYFDVKVETNLSGDFKIYSDGSCAVHSSKQGRWAYVMIDEQENIIHEEGQTVQDTTNGEMELHGLYNSLLYASENVKNSSVIIYCDSSYVVNGYNEWCNGWKNKGWKKANNTPVKYSDVWKKIDKIRSSNIEVEWVRGHNGNKWNEYVDSLTRKY